MGPDIEGVARPGPFQICTNSKGKKSIRWQRKVA
jgi:hypothetical protein